MGDLESCRWLFIGNGIRLRKISWKGGNFPKDSNEAAPGTWYWQLSLTSQCSDLTCFIQSRKCRDGTAWTVFMMRCRAAQLGMSSHPPAHHIYVQAAPLWPGEVSATWTSYTAGKHANIWWMRCYGTVIQWYTMILYILYIFCNDSTLYVEFPSCNVSSLSSKQFRRRVQPSHPTPGNRAREYTRGHYKTTWLYIRIYRII